MILSPTRTCNGKLLALLLTNFTFIFYAQNKSVFTFARIISQTNDDNNNTDTDNTVDLLNRKNQEKNYYLYLYSNLMRNDMSISVTLGFPPFMKDIIPSSTRFTHDWKGGEKEEVSDNNDKLSQIYADDGELPGGIVGTNINLAIHTKSYPWTDKVSEDIFMEYIVSFVNLNEPRTNWRPLLKEVLEPTVKRLLQQHNDNNRVDMRDVVHAVNNDLWSALGGIVFKEHQTPLIFDPMSTIAYKHASCTGLSILLVNALRSVGVPARIAGTPAWNNKREHGNHSWLEVYIPDIGQHRKQEDNTDKWMFLEASPIAGHVPGYALSPCSFWFCKKDRFDGTTKVYAARLDTSKTAAHFPLSWDTNNHDVPAEDRTEIMNDICSKCE